MLSNDMCVVTHWRIALFYISIRSNRSDDQLGLQEFKDNGGLPGGSKLPETGAYSSRAKEHMHGGCDMTTGILIRVVVKINQNTSQ